MASIEGVSTGNAGLQKRGVFASRVVSYLKNAFLCTFQYIPYRQSVPRNDSAAHGRLPHAVIPGESRHAPQAVPTYGGAPYAVLDGAYERDHQEAEPPEPLTADAERLREGGAALLRWALRTCVTRLCHAVGHWSRPSAYLRVQGRACRAAY